MIAEARLKRGDYRVAGSADLGAKLVALVIDSGYQAATAKDIADVLGVPLRTAHKWVSRARRLGLLPPRKL